MSCIEVGSEVPDFELKDQNGNLVKLSSLRGKIVVLYFYPKAMTRGCTIEAVGFRDFYNEIASLNAVVVGVSKDDVADLKKFSEKYSLPFILLSDLESKLIDAFCVRGFAGRARRVTFIIDEKGVVIKKWNKVDPSKHAKEVVEFLRSIKRS